MIGNFCFSVSFDLKEVKELDQAKTAADCFMILWKEEIITSSNVMALKFLLKETKCEELERKCVEYAKKGDSMYYYEKPQGIIVYIEIIA